VKISDRLGNSIRISAPFGNLKTMTNAVHNTSRYEYDRLNRRTSMTDSAGGVTKSTYDGYGNVIEQTDALGRVTKTVYDNLNRATEVNRPLGVKKSTIYDAINKRFMTDGKGRTTEYSYRQIWLMGPINGLSRCRMLRVWS
jgi:YD repeat-containing protein